MAIHMLLNRWLTEKKIKLISCSKHPGHSRIVCVFLSLLFQEDAARIHKRNGLGFSQFKNKKVFRSSQLHIEKNNCNPITRKKYQAKSHRRMPKQNKQTNPD